MTDMNLAPGPDPGPSEASPSTLICSLWRTDVQRSAGLRNEFTLTKGQTEADLFQLTVRPDERQTSGIRHEAPRLCLV